MGGLLFVQGGLTLNFDKISTDLSSVIFQFGRVGALFGMTKPTNALS